MRKILLIFNLVSLILLFFSCEKTKLPVLPQGKALQLEVAEAGVTEAWLQVKIGVKEPGQQLRLYREGELVQQLAIDRDTVVYDSGLAPAHNYTYHAELWKSGSKLGKTNNITLTTMDTTSHDFQWEVITIPSPFGSGALYDVAIINENDIWAVGEIYSDSTQPWLPYNAVHWDGSRWLLKRITVKFRNSNITPPGEGIFAFSENDIWVTLGGAPAHWDGKSWKFYHLWDMGVLGPNDGGVTRIWGSSPDNLYFVGRSGTIVHYDGSRWQRIESGTDLPLKDIFGLIRENRKSYQILVVASNNETMIPAKSVILEIEENKIISHPNTPPGEYISTIWFSIPGKYFIADINLYSKYQLEEFQWHKILTPHRYAISMIRGNSYNDFFTVGSFGEIFHFNGLSWHRIGELFYGSLAAISIKRNLAVAVGFTVRDGRIVVLRRQ